MGDYNLANLSGAQFRAELNLILTDLQGNEYAATAPLTTRAGQIWIDSSGALPVLRIRNALNNGWIGITAADVANVASGTIAATNVQAALNELGTEKAALAGAAFTGPVSFTAGDVNLATEVVLPDSNTTMTAANMVNSKIFVGTPTANRNVNTAIATNIIAQLGGYVVGTTCAFTIVNLAAFNLTLVGGTGVTIVGNAVINNGSGTFRIRVDSATTVTIYTEAAIVAVAAVGLDALERLTVGTVVKVKNANSTQSSSIFTIMGEVGFMQAGTVTYKAGQQVSNTGNTSTMRFKRSRGMVLTTLTTFTRTGSLSIIERSVDIAVNPGDTLYIEHSIGSGTGNSVITTPYIYTDGTNIFPAPVYSNVESTVV